MSIARKILMGAAGAGSKTTYVDDVFSTYLYKGTDTNQRIDNGLKLGNANAGNSVYFGGFGDGSDYLQMAHSTDLCFGNGDFTIECWAYAAKHDGWNGIFGNWGGAGSFGYVLETVSGDLEFYWYNAAGSYTLVQGAAVPLGQWSHLCVCRSGNTLRVFVNGTMYGSGVSMTEGIRDGTTDFTIGGRVAGGGWWDGNITNLRITKGQGLYTSNFTPSTEPFTTTSQGATASNVKLLCCNKDTVTGSTVTPGTITAFGSPTASNFGTGTASDGEGGLVWLKERTGTNWHQLYDTARGVGYALSSNSTNASSFEADKLTAFNNAGFSIGVNDIQNDTGDDYTSWSFRKSKGFFDIVTYTGNGTTAQNISHNLGSVPGMIMVKRTDATSNWWVYNRGIGATKSLFLQSPTSASTDSRYWNNTSPTASQFTVGEYPNTSGGSYIAYLFAGGESTADTARSVFFDGASDHMRLSLASSTDLDMGTGDFTIEFWYNYKNTNTSARQAIISSNTVWGSGFTQIQVNHPSHINHILLWDYDIDSSNPVLKSTNTFPNNGTWRHVAISRSGSALKMFVNGILENSVTQTGSLDFSDSYGTYIGYYPSNTGLVADISNLRVVKGTAVYTSSFRPPYEPLTNITNTKLLCCNNSSVTGATVTPGTITAIANPTAITDNPFDDPEGFKFGEEGDQNLIKCGSFTTDSNEDADVYLGWEPQWVIIKRTDGGSHGFNLVDSMRGFPNAQDVEDNASGQCKVLEANFDSAEITGARYGLTPTGFYADQYGANRSYVYMAMRRPDPLVGKPPEVGTDVFAMDVGDNNSTIPEWYSEFPVDFGFFKATAANQDWYLSARLVQAEVLYPNATNDEDGYGDAVFDSNLGWGKSASGTYGTAYQSWMWKRYAGMDVVTYGGNQVSREVRHNLNAVPEMIWSKDRTDNSDWIVYHKGLNGGTNPATKFLYLNKSDAENGWVVPWNDTEPTSVWYPVQASTMFNKTGNNYLTMLFASVEGISKVGSYTGNNSSSGPTITTGFSPRFLIIKRANGVDNWFVFDTLRGISNSGNDARLKLDESGAQTTNGEWLSVSSTGFTLKTSDTGVNASSSYIYYAHA